MPMLMHPRPMAETCGPLRPSLRYFMARLLSMGDPSLAHGVSQDRTGTRLQAGPYFDSKRLQRVANAAGAADRAGGPVDRREEPVARRIDLAAAEPLELAAHDLVVAREEAAPRAIAQARGVLSGTDDVRHEHGGKDPVGLALG